MVWIVERAGFKTGFRLQRRWQPQTNQKTRQGFLKKGKKKKRKDYSDRRHDKTNDMIGSVLPGQPRAGHDVLYSFMKPIDRQVGSVRPVGNQGKKKNSQMSWPCRRRRRSTECWIHWRASIGFYDSKFPYKRSTSLDGCSLFLFLSLSLFDYFDRTGDSLSPLSLFPVQLRDWHTHWENDRVLVRILGPLWKCVPH